MHGKNQMPELSRSITNFYLKRLLPYYLTIIFIITSLGSIYWFFNRSPYTFGDWLINYQGGFTRRGFGGEVVYQVAKMTSLNPGFFIILLHCFFYGIFFFATYKLLKKQRSLTPFSLLIFSPAVFLFQINDPGGGYRKEIIYFCLLSTTVLMSHTKDVKKFNIFFYLLLTIYPFIILTHEVLAILLPVFLAVYFFRIKASKKNVKYLTALVIPSVASLILTTTSRAPQDRIDSIYTSLAKIEYPIDRINGGAIDWLNKDTKYGIKSVLVRIIDPKRNHLEFFTLAILIASISFFPIRKKIKTFFSNKLPSFLAISSLIGLLPVYLVAFDWGRWLNIQIVTIFLLSLAPKEKSNKDIGEENPHYLLSLVFVTYYCLSWRLPHTLVGDIFNKNYKETFIFKMFTPIKSAVKYYMKR